MKKVFLSLATIAFVAAGSLTMTSCGGDDSTPTPPGPPTPDDVVPGVQADNTVRHNNVDTPLDFSYYELVTRDYTNSADGTKFEAPVIYNYPDGGYAYAYYVNLGYNLAADGSSADTYHYAMILVKNETIVIQDNAIADFGELILPNQTDDVYWAMAYVLLSGTEYQSSQNDPGTGEVTVNTLALQEGGVGTTNVVSTFTLGDDSFNFKFNGDTEFTTYKETGAKGVTSPKAKLYENIKNLEVQVTKVIK